MKTTPGQARMFVLIDAAASPSQVHPLLVKSGTEFQSVYAGMPEDELGPAALFLARIDDPSADWVTELDRIDLQWPCLSLLWSRVELSELAKHLQAFLIVDIGDGMNAFLRYFDPRNFGAVLDIWGGEIRRIFMGPIERVMYRGRHAQWQRVENDTSAGLRLCKSIVVRLSQAEIDTLAAHSEPDEIMAVLVEKKLIDEAQPYLTRHGDFLPRYQRALQWGLVQPACRLNFCRHTYLHGRDFDRHPSIEHVLLARSSSGDSYLSAMKRVPDYVWDELKRGADQ